MMRTAVFLISVFCVATVLTELLGVTYLWLNGQLTPTAMEEIRVALGGEAGEVPDEDAARKAAQKSNDEVLRMRIERGWDLQRRMKEVRILSTMTAEKAAELKSDRDKLQEIRGEFQKQLAAMEGKLTDAAVERARAVLLKMEPAEAVRNLMSATLEQNVILLTGMPEKSIATILQEFLRGEDKKQIEREQQIFEAIYAGQPKRKVFNNTAGRLGAQPMTMPDPAIGTN